MDGGERSEGRWGGGTGKRREKETTPGLRYGPLREGKGRGSKGHARRWALRGGRALYNSTPSLREGKGSEDLDG